ncbi:MAG: NfeD family protein [Chitinophagales bacterium]
MLSFFENMDTLLQGFWVVSIGVTAIFLIQTLLTILGGDLHHDVDFDIDADADGADAPFSLFSVRNMINFLLGFGWTGVAFYNQIQNKTLLIVLAFFVGVIFLLAFFFLIKQILKLSEDNTFKVNELIGKTGEVYLNIPENNNGKGKVLISIKGTTRELPATTKGEAIASSSIVKVVAIDNNILEVEKI